MEVSGCISNESTCQVYKTEAAMCVNAPKGGESYLFDHYISDNCLIETFKGALFQPRRGFTR